METVLGIDLGTQNHKVMVYRYQTDQIIASADAPLAVEQDQDGKSEQQAH